MSTFDRVKKLADKQKISIVELEEKLNFSRNSLYAWKRSKPSVDKLQKVADYFNVSTDYLLGRSDTPELSKKDVKDLQQQINNIIDGLSNESSIAYMKNGDSELTPEAVELLRASLENVAKQAKILAKDKFTPKKYRKNDGE